MKKLSKLKTLDTKTGNATVQSPDLGLETSFVAERGVFLRAGIYTAYKTFLHKDKILIKRLLKVSHQSPH